MLLDLETKLIEGHLIRYERNSSLLHRAPAHTLSTKVWEESRTRLSRLLDEETDLADLIKFYELIRIVNEIRRDRNNRATLVVALPQLREQCDKAIAVIRKYVPREALEGTPMENITFPLDPERGDSRTR